MKIDSTSLDHKILNEKIHAVTEPAVTVANAMGQRYIGCGMKDKLIEIEGTPGNALGAYLDGATIRVFGNGQDAVGDTMNEGRIYIHGSCGDAAGYAMRGGKIMINGDVGYRSGIHMKEYEDKVPAVVIGGNAGSFLGEYQAGGTIIVLGLSVEDKPRVGYFCGTGMHGGRIYLRSTDIPMDLPAQVASAPATPEDMELIRSEIQEFCQEFEKDFDEVFNAPYIVLTPNTNNPYKQLYVAH
ncbi:MAG: glutamate synthase [Bacillota bacterium]|nr:glutamate synthase [Bacillota bacterium]